MKIIVVLLILQSTTFALSPESILARQRINRVRVTQEKMTESFAEEITKNQIRELRFLWKLKAEGYAAAKARNRAYIGAHNHRLEMKNKIIYRPVYQNPSRTQNEHSYPTFNNNGLAPIWQRERQ